MRAKEKTNFIEMLKREGAVFLERIDDDLFKPPQEYQVLDADKEVLFKLEKNRDESWKIDVARRNLGHIRFFTNYIPIGMETVRIKLKLKDEDGNNLAGYVSLITETEKDKVRIINKYEAYHERYEVDIPKIAEWKRKGGIKEIARDVMQSNSEVLMNDYYEKEIE